MYVDKEETIWVGIDTATKQFVIWDRLIGENRHSRRLASHYSVFHSPSWTMHEIPTNAIFESIKSAKDRAVEAKALGQKYAAARLDVRAQALQELHQKHLLREGFPVSRPSVQISRDISRHRLTHCWKCQGTLDSHNDFECIRCHWMICQCGACGCGYRFRKSR